jgi:Fe-S-cluster-containing dehydrogenase component
MCYDRTSIGKKPMCATVCPSQALFFGTREEIDRLRPRSIAINQFQFGGQRITTKVNMMVPRRGGPEHLDVTATLAEDSEERPDVMLDAIHPAALAGERS